MSFEKLLKPKSVAVVGASADQKKVGNNVLENIISGGYTRGNISRQPQGRRTSREEMLSIPSCHSRPGRSRRYRDQARHGDPDAQGLRSKGIEAVITITAGFGETGEEGKLQREIAQIARQNKITLLGPNCLGLINPWHKLNASFGQAPASRAPSPSFPSRARSLPRSRTWRRTKRSASRCSRPWATRRLLTKYNSSISSSTTTTTSVIAAYLEDISRGQDFMRVAERVSKNKPVVILKIGPHRFGRQSGLFTYRKPCRRRRAYDSAFERTGVIRADSIENLFDISIAFAYQPLPKGDRIAVVTNAGGPGHHDDRCA